MIQRYRLASQTRQVLTWNSASQLRAVTTTRNYATQTLQFVYDGSGRRIRKTVVGGSSTDHVWDGDQIVAETDTVGVTQRLYTHFPGTAQLNSMVAGRKTYYAAQDAAGNVIGMFDWTSPSTSNKYTYQPFGTMDQNEPPRSCRRLPIERGGEHGKTTTVSPKVKEWAVPAARSAGALQRVKQRLPSRYRPLEAAALGLDKVITDNSTASSCE